MHSAPNVVLEASGQEPAAQDAWQVLRLTGWRQARRAVVTIQAQKTAPLSKIGELRKLHTHEFSAYATIRTTDNNAWQIQQLCRERAATETVLDELKNQWASAGFCTKARSITELAAGLQLRILRSVGGDVRFLVPQEQTNAKPVRPDRRYCPQLKNVETLLAETTSSRVSGSA